MIHKQITFIFFRVQFFWSTSSNYNLIRFCTSITTVRRLLSAVFCPYCARNSLLEDQKHSIVSKMRLLTNTPFVHLTLIRFCSSITTVRPLLSAELDYPRFLRLKLSTPNLYEIQSDLYYSHLYYPQFLRPKFSTPKYRG